MSGTLCQRSLRHIHMQLLAIVSARLCSLYALSKQWPAELIMEALLWPLIDPVGGHGLLQLVILSGGRGFESQRRQVLIFGFPSGYMLRWGAVVGRYARWRVRYAYSTRMVRVHRTSTEDDRHVTCWRGLQLAIPVLRRYGHDTADVI